MDLNGVMTVLPSVPSVRRLRGIAMRYSLTNNLVPAGHYERPDVG